MTIEIRRRRTGALLWSGEAATKKHGTQYAATLIYWASTGRVPHFFATKERALEDLRRCADEDTAEVSP